METDFRHIGSFGPVMFLNAILAIASQAASWTTNAPMGSTRQFHIATLLTNGLVLAAGGEDENYQAIASAEIYVPSSESWTNTGSMNEARELFTATRLTNGLVLVAGGVSSIGFSATAELYDPATGLWSWTGSMTNARCAHTATLLANGNVLVTGGENGGALAGAEVYDVVQRAWMPTEPMHAERGYHTATLLLDGRVLVSGGRDTNYVALRSAEVYDATAGEWTLTGPMNLPRWSHTATQIPSDGKVLVVGGHALGAELYNDSSGEWTFTLVNGVTNVLNGQTETLLPNGSILVASGIDTESAFDTTTQAWIFDPYTVSWNATAQLNQGRYGHTATVLANGYVLVTGGGNFVSPFRLSSVESFVPVDPIILTATTLPNGQFRLSFTNTPGFRFDALFSTNVSPNLGNWTALGGISEISPGQFQFTDPQATNSPQRFYRVRAN
jgi:hypothetical protein